MNLLIDKLPEAVEIDGLEYPINTDFRISVMFEQLLADASLTEQEKLVQALRLYYPMIPGNIPAALEQILWFYRCGKEQKAAEDDKPSAAVFDYDYDDQYIYAAYLDQYGIDLQDAKLHWWKFKAMFAGLKEDNKLCKIMSYRAMDIPGDMPKAQKEFYKKMKKLYEIPLPQTQQDKLNEIEAALMGDGNLNGIL